MESRLEKPSQSQTPQHPPHSGFSFSMLLIHPGSNPIRIGLKAPGPLNTGKQAAQNPISSWNFLPEASPGEVSFQDNTFPNKVDFVSKLSSGEMNSSKKKKDVKARGKILKLHLKNLNGAALMSGLGLPTFNHPRNSPGSSGDSACGTQTARAPGWQWRNS